MFTCSIFRKGFVYYFKYSALIVVIVGVSRSNTSHLGGGGGRVELNVGKEEFLLCKNFGIKIQLPPLFWGYLFF